MFYEKEERVSNIDIMCHQTKSLVPRKWTTSAFYSVSIKTKLILPDWFSHTAHFFQYFLVSLLEKNVLTGVEDKQTVSSFIF